MPKPELTQLKPGEREPVTYFELQRRADAKPEIGGESPATAFPPLPPTSPWHHDPVPAEPLIDRTEDADHG
jgi:hypothetical protein